MRFQVGGSYTLTRTRRGIWKLQNINKTGSSDFINSMFRLANINPGSFSDENKTPEQLFNAWFQSSGLKTELKRRSGLSERRSNSRSEIVLGKSSDRGNQSKIPTLLDNLLNNVNGRDISEKLGKLDREIYKVSSSGGGSRKSYITDQLQGRGTGRVRLSRDKVLNYLNQNTLSLRTSESSGRASVNPGHSRALTNSQNAATESHGRLRTPTPPPDTTSTIEFPSLGTGTFDYLTFGTAALTENGTARKSVKKSGKGSKTRKRRQTKKAKKKSKKKTRKKSLKNIFKYFF